MDSKVIGARLRELRGSRSQAEVAQAVGITQAALGNYEAGTRIPRDEIKIKLAAYYKRSVTSLFFK